MLSAPGPVFTTAFQTTTKRPQTTIWKSPVISGRFSCLRRSERLGTTRNDPRRLYGNQPLLAICDAHYIFSFVNIGDSGVLENSVVGKAFAHDALCVPDPEPVEGCDIPLLYFIVGDDIFGLKTWLLRSFTAIRSLTNSQLSFVESKTCPRECFWYFEGKIWCIQQSHSSISGNRRRNNQSSCVPT